MIYKKHQRGETLIEVITALTALVMAGIAAVTIIISVMHSNSISKEYLIAQNLAREGIEGVITIRNTNWLQYPSDKDTKWLCTNPTDSSCANKISASENYALKRVDSTFILDKKPAATLDLSNGLDTEFELQLVSLDGIPIYNHGSGTPTTPTFYRMIQFKALTTTSYQVTVTIQWLNKSEVSEYKLTSIITNYAK